MYYTVLHVITVKPIYFDHLLKMCLFTDGGQNQLYKHYWDTINHVVFIERWFLNADGYYSFGDSVWMHVVFKVHHNIFLTVFLFTYSICHTVEHELTVTCINQISSLYRSVRKVPNSLNTLQDHCISRSPSV